MRTIDHFVLRGMHKLCNFTYKKFGIDNYVVGVAFFLLALCASVKIYMVAQRMADADVLPEVALFRIQSAQFAACFFGLLAVFFLAVSKTLRYYLQMAHDTNTAETQPMIIVALNWAPVAMYLHNVALAAIGHSTYWNMLDCGLIGVGIMFLRSKPPLMEERMKKEIAGW